MPKAAKTKSTRVAASAHQPSVKPVKRQFAVQDNAVEHVEVGALADVSAPEILHDMASSDGGHDRATMKKKEKLAVKKDAFLNRLALSDSSSHPYSKSHARRMKRKEREQVAGGLSDIKDAIGDLLGDEAPSETIAESNKKAAKRKQTEMDVEGDEEPKKTKTVQAGVIGQGKSTTLTKAQRKRALELERLRHPRILSNPAYSSNPFETIRTHAQNTLVKHQPT